MKEITYSNVNGIKADNTKFLGVKEIKSAIKREEESVVVELSTTNGTEKVKKAHKAKKVVEENQDLGDKK